MVPGENEFDTPEVEEDRIEEDQLESSILLDSFYFILDQEVNYMFLPICLVKKKDQKLWPLLLFPLNSSGLQLVLL